MKKNPIIFIAMLIALAFTSCQMNTDDSDNIPDSSYAVAIADNLKDGSANGKIATDKESAKAGETVTLTITPNSGYVLDSLSVKMLNAEITATISDDKTSATFTMPEKDVAINVTFKAATVTPTDDNGGEEVEDPVDDTPAPTPTTPTEATSYKVVYNDQELKAGLTLEQVNAYITQISLVETTDYSINKVKGEVILTDSGYNKLNNYFATNGEPTTTEPTDTTDDGVVYAACRIFLPTVVEHGTIKITNKGKDGNVVKKVYKDNTGVYPGADEGDTIELTLHPDSDWEPYGYFKYENELTVENAFGEKLILTRGRNIYYWTFTMPKTYVKVELPYGFEKPYSLTLDKPTNKTAKIFDPIGATVGKRKPGDVVYVMVVGNEVPRIEGLKRNGAYKYDDITFKNITEEVSSFVENNCTYVKVDVNDYPVANGSWDLAGAHFYSFIMPRDSITIKLTDN